MSAGDRRPAARTMLLIIAPLKPFAENSSKAASKICARLSNSSAKTPLCWSFNQGHTPDRTFSQEVEFGVESGYRRTVGYSYGGVDLREHPEEYRIGRGEQGVFHAEPYKGELLPLWKFKDEEA